MVATTAAIARGLNAGDRLLYRYLPERSADGLDGDEGAFLLCGFWLVDNLASQGRLDEALALYESLCDRAGQLGLLPRRSTQGPAPSSATTPRRSATSASSPPAST